MSNEPVPDIFLCPISQQIMYNPVTATDGNTYEKEEIERIIKFKKISPLTREELGEDVLENRNLKKRIEDFLQKNPQHKSQQFSPSIVGLPTIVGNLRSITSDSFWKLQRKVEDIEKNFGRAQTIGMISIIMAFSIFAIDSFSEEREIHRSQAMWAFLLTGIVLAGGPQALNAIRGYDSSKNNENSANDKPKLS
jgi:hypothetical protein